MVLTGLNEEGLFGCIDECPKCGKTNANIIDSRLDDTLSLRVRCKKCKHCGHKWNTVEIMLSDFECMTELNEAHELDILRTVNKELNNQIKALQTNTIRLMNISQSFENKVAARQKNMAKDTETMFNYKYRR